MVYLNITRLLVYIVLILLAVLGQVPWWTAPLLVLYDLTYYVHFLLPWKRKEWEAQQQIAQAALQQKWLEQWQGNRRNS